MEWNGSYKACRGARGGFCWESNSHYWSDDGHGTSRLVCVKMDTKAIFRDALIALQWTTPYIFLPIMSPTGLWISFTAISTVPVVRSCGFPCKLSTVLLFSQISTSVLGPYRIPYFSAQLWCELSRILTGKQVQKSKPEDVVCTADQNSYLCVEYE